MNSPKGGERLRAALSVTVALVALMLCTTLVVSEVSAAPVGTVGISSLPGVTPSPLNGLLSFLAGFVAHLVYSNQSLLNNFRIFLVHDLGSAGAKTFS